MASTRSNKGALLLVLKFPELPLHNNPAELGARGRVRKRDVSFGPPDLTPGQISQLACLGTHMPPGNILFAGFPRELFKPGEIYDPALKQKVFIWETDFDKLRNYVKQFNAGVWPAQSLFATPEPEMGGCQ